MIAKPAPVAGPPLAARGKPEILYVATEYCPYCATQSWAMIVALSRFGTFTRLRTIRSGTFNSALMPTLTGQSFPPLDTWTFQIAAALEDPHGIRGQSILGTVNYITAAICHLTGDQPAAACTPAVRSLLPGT